MHKIPNLSYSMVKVRVCSFVLKFHLRALFFLCIPCGNWKDSLNSKAKGGKFSVRLKLRWGSGSFDLRFFFFIVDVVVVVVVVFVDDEGTYGNCVNIFEPTIADIFTCGT